MTAPLVDYAGPGNSSRQHTQHGRHASSIRLRVVVITGLMVAVFWPALQWLGSKTAPVLGDANWQHSFFVPLIGLYYLYLNREPLLNAQVKPLLWGRFARLSRLAVGGGMLLAGTLGWWLFSENVYISTASLGLASYGVLVLTLDWGLGTVVLGLLMYAYGINPGQNNPLQALAGVLTTFGVVLLLCGWDVMKIAWFPILFLVCAIPWPELVYSWVALPLQELAATVAAGTLKMTGVEAFRAGTKLFIGEGNQQRVLNVAEACAGLKSLMTFVTLAAAMGFVLSNRVMWQRILITVSAVPIAILCNVIRVSGQGLLDHYVSQKLSESFAHQFVGLIMLIPAVFLLGLVGWVLDNLFVEEVDKRAVQERGKRESLVIEIPRGKTEAPSARSAGAAAAGADELAAATQRLMSAAGGRRAKSPSGTLRSHGQKAEGR